MIFVPPRFAADSILEAAGRRDRADHRDHRGHPRPRRAARLQHAQARPRPGSRLIGPNCPGILSPGKANVGIIPASFFKAGNVGVVSRSGTLTYQIGNEIAQRASATLDRRHRRRPRPGHRLRGRDRAVPGRRRDRADRDVGRDRRLAEEEAADFIAEHVTKPVVAYIAGFTAPPGKQMGHAGAIVSGSSGTAAAKAAGARGQGRARRAHPHREHRCRGPRRHVRRRFLTQPTLADNPQPSCPSRLRPVR
jgi:succinyl-CoA synthetase alpha subunit